MTRCRGGLPADRSRRPPRAGRRTGAGTSDVADHRLIGAGSTGAHNRPPRRYPDLADERALQGEVRPRAGGLDSTHPVDPDDQGWRRRRTVPALAMHAATRREPSLTARRLAPRPPAAQEVVGASARCPPDHASIRHSPPPWRRRVVVARGRASRGEQLRRPVGGPGTLLRLQRSQDPVSRDARARWRAPHSRLDAAVPVV